MCMYDPIAVRWSANHQSRVEVHYMTEKSEFVYDLMKEIGLKWYVRQPHVRSLIGLSEINFRSGDECRRFLQRSRAAMAAALKKDDPIIWVVFGEHSMYSFRFSLSGEPRPKFSDTWVTGFVVVDRKKWRKALPEVPCTAESCLAYLREHCEPVIDADLNGTLKTCRYVDEEEGDDHWFGEFLDADDALKEALLEHPECKYRNEDFDVTVEYRLNPKTA